MERGSYASFPKAREQLGIYTTSIGPFMKFATIALCAFAVVSAAHAADPAPTAKDLRRLLQRESAGSQQGDAGMRRKGFRQPPGRRAYALRSGSRCVAFPALQTVKEVTVGSPAGRTEPD